MTLPIAIWIVLGSNRPLVCIANGVIFHILLVFSINVVFRLNAPEAITITMYGLTAGFAVPVAICSYFKHDSLEKEL